MALALTGYSPRWGDGQKKEMNFLESGAEPSGVFTSGAQEKRQPRTVCPCQVDIHPPAVLLNGRPWQASRLCFNLLFYGDVLSYLVPLYKYHFCFWYLLLRLMHCTARSVFVFILREQQSFSSLLKIQ